MFQKRSSRMFSISLVCVICMLDRPVRGSDRVDIEELAWMEGRWAVCSQGTEMEEIWTAPKGGIMLGLHRDVQTGKPAFFEYLRIEDRDGGLVYVASPRGAGSTAFGLVSAHDELVVFENLEHDFPQRIIYIRDGDRLTARVEGLVDGEVRSSVWVWEFVE